MKFQLLGAVTIVAATHPPVAPFSRIGSRLASRHFSVTKLHSFDLHQRQEIHSFIYEIIGFRMQARNGP